MNLKEKIEEIIMKKIFVSPQLAETAAHEIVKFIKTNYVLKEKIAETIEQALKQRKDCPESKKSNKSIGTPEG